MKKINIPMYIIITLIVSGCFSTHKGNPQLSDSIRISNNHLTLIPIIDGRENKNGTDDIKDTKDYTFLFNKLIIRRLNRAGYTTEIINAEISACKSLGNVSMNKEIGCVDNIYFQNNNVVFLISIDNFSKQIETINTATAYATGVIYDTRSKKILWKNSVSKEIGNDILMYGLGGGIVNWIAKRKADKNSDFEAAATHVIITLMDTVPEYK